MPCYQILSSYSAVTLKKHYQAFHIFYVQILYHRKQVTLKKALYIEGHAKYIFWVF